MFAKAYLPKPHSHPYVFCCMTWLCQLTYNYSIHLGSSLALDQMRKVPTRHDMLTTVLNKINHLILSSGKNSWIKYILVYQMYPPLERNNSLVPINMEIYKTKF